MRIWTFILALLLVVSLAACASNPAAESSGVASLGPLSADYEEALPPMQQLVVGTFVLADGDLAVTGEQARTMAALWKGYRALSANELASVQEMQGLSEQLVESMTEEQLRAIAEMMLTREDMDAVMEIHLARGSGGGGVEPSAELMATREAHRAEAGGDASGDLAGSGGGGGAGSQAGGFGASVSSTLSEEQLAAIRAQRAATGATMVPAPLLEALIALLEAGA
jgi:hypothetical protein